MNKINYLTEAENICNKGIDNHKYIPEHMKPEAKEIVQSCFKTISKSIAAIQLADLRQKSD